MTPLLTVHARIKATAFSLSPWVVVAATDVFLKTRVLKNTGMEKAAIAMGRGVESVTRVERITFLRGDLLVSCLLIPILLFCLVYFLPARLRWLATWFIGLVAFLCEIILFAQYGSFLSIGRFANVEIIREGVRWWFAHPESGTGTPGKRLVIELFVSAILIIISFAIAAYVARKPESAVATWLWRAIMAGAVAVVLGLVVTWVPKGIHGVFNADLLSTMVRATFTDSTTVDPAILKMSVPELRQLYREITRTPTDGKLPEFFGKARDYNVVLLILETAPARILDPAVDDLHDMPNLRRLREHAFVSAHHYTTFPATNRATFSILTSDYMTADFGWSAGDVAVPGMIRSLGQAGYETAFYGYSWEGGGDITMLKDLGFQRMVNSDLKTIAFLPSMELGLPWEERVKRDAAPLHGLESDIRSWAARGQKFAVQFSPELGHAPWPAMGNNPNEAMTGANMDARGHALVVYQDAWLGEIIRALEETHILDKTIIVVTGDHGIRFKAEHPDLPLGMIDDMSFHVPLLVYVPGLLKSTERIHSPTSHIDIQPTVLDLLGIENGREWEEGSPIWDPSLDHRRVFLLADMLFGADGYWEDGKYFMEQNDSGAVFENDTDRFPAGTALLPDNPKAVEVRANLKTMVSVEQAIRLHLQGGVLRGSAAKN